MPQVCCWPALRGDVDGHLPGFDWECALLGDVLQLHLLCLLLCQAPRRGVFIRYEWVVVAPVGRAVQAGSGHHGVPGQGSRRGVVGWSGVAGGCIVPSGIPRLRLVSVLTRITSSAPLSLLPAMQDATSLRRWCRITACIGQPWLACHSPQLASWPSARADTRCLRQREGGCLY